MLNRLRPIIVNRCYFRFPVPVTGDRVRDPAPLQHNPGHGELHVAQRGDAAGGHAGRARVQRGAVGARLQVRVRGQNREVHAGLGQVRGPGAAPVRAKHAAVAQVTATDRPEHELFPRRRARRHKR